jgi:hypothetical protein
LVQLPKRTWPDGLGAAGVTDTTLNGVMGAPTVLIHRLAVIRRKIVSGIRTQPRVRVGRIADVWLEAVVAGLGKFLARNIVHDLLQLPGIEAAKHIDQRLQ